jgi:hypothetical protein
VSTLGKTNLKDNNTSNQKARRRMTEIRENQRRFFPSPKRRATSSSKMGGS